MSENRKRGATVKNKTLRTKNFVYALESGDLERFDVRVMEQYPAYYHFFPRFIIDAFIKRHNITDVKYRQFHYLCKIVIKNAMNTKPGFKAAIGRKRVKKGRFAHVRFYSDTFLLAAYEAIRKANLVEGQEQDTKEAC